MAPPGGDDLGDLGVRHDVEQHGEADAPLLARRELPRSEWRVLVFSKPLLFYISAQGMLL